MEKKSCLWHRRTCVCRRTPCSLTSHRAIPNDARRASRGRRVQPLRSTLPAESTQGPALNSPARRRVEKGRTHDKPHDVISTQISPPINIGLYHPLAVLLSPSPTRQHHHDISKTVPEVILHSDGEGASTSNQTTAFWLTARRGIDSPTQEDRRLVSRKSARLAKPQACCFEHPRRSRKLCS